MPGGLLNIIAYGNQNIILNGNPKKTFFKSVYAKYTNFGVQKFRIDYNGSRDIDPLTDSIYTFKIPRNAELLLDTYLVFDIPNIWSTILPPLVPGDIWKPYHFRWIDNLGTSMIKTVRVMVGNKIIQEYPGEYIRCMAERDYSEEKKKMFNEMIGNTTELTQPEYYGGNRNNNYPNTFFSPDIAGQEPSIRSRKIYVPLNPWFMTNPKMAFPLVSLQYSELVIEVVLRPLREMFTINNIQTVDDDLINTELDYSVKLNNLYSKTQPNFTNDRHNLYRFLQPPPTIALTRADYSDYTSNWKADVHLITNYAFLTAEESKIFALNEQKYLMKEIKHSVYYDIVGTRKIKINTNALVSGWLWYYRRSDANKRNEWSNYTNWETKIIPYKLLQSESATPYTISNGNSEQIGPARDYEANDGVSGLTTYATNHKVTPTFSLEYTKYILQKFSIIIDGKNRENEFDAGVYNYIENYRTTKVSSNSGIYTYNFTLDTSNYLQPSGAINMNRFKNIEFEMTTLIPNLDPEVENLVLCDENGDVIGITKNEPLYLYTYEFHLFEERYNILRFISGNAGLMFVH